jgi:transcriptional regulator with XRE-family HTH domain
MSSNLREIIKKIGITQQELADYLGITRQYLNQYLDETLEDQKLPEKYLENILFLFECQSRDELFDSSLVRNSKQIRKRMQMIKTTRESMNNLFNVENEKKLELFKIIDYLHALIKLDDELLESLAVLIESISKENTYHTLLSYIGKRNLIIEFEDEKYNQPRNRVREALLFQALEKDIKDTNHHEALYEEFKMTTKRQNNIDLEALKISLNELGYTNISQKEVLDIFKKYNQIKLNEKE